MALQNRNLTPPLLWPLKWALLLTAAYSILAFCWLWPMPSHPDRFLLSYSNPGDAMHSIWSTWWWHAAGSMGERFELCPFVAYPFGVDLSLSPPQPVLEFPLRALGKIFGEMPSYNFWLFLSYPLSGLAMFLLVWSVTRDSWASFISGALFSCAPYRSAHTPQLGLVMTHWVPLTLWGFWKLRFNPTMPWAALCGILLLVTGLSDYYYGFLVGMSLGMLFLLDQILTGAKKPSEPHLRWKSLAAACGIALVSGGVIALIVFPRHAQAAMGDRGWPMKDLFVYSAKPWDYLLPSVRHTWIGNCLAPFIENHLFGSNITEQTLFLGWIPLLVSLGVVWCALTKRFNPQRRKTTLLFFGLFLGAVVWSAPPFLPLGEFQMTSREIVSKFKLPFPSYFMWRILPMFRVYARFGLIALVALLVLVGIGVACVRQNTHGKGRKILPLAVLCLTLAEFMVHFDVFDGSRVPTVYRWLSTQPENSIIVEYPWREPTYQQTYQYLFFQRVHKKPIANGGSLGTKAEELRQQLRDITQPAVVPILKELGVRYVIVHPFLYEWKEDPLQNELRVMGRVFPVRSRRSVEHLPPPSREANPRLHLIRDFSDAWVYDLSL